MPKMARGKRPHKHCEHYLNNRHRISNKTRKLEKRLKVLEKSRETNEIINLNTKLPTKRKPIENIIKNCRIGRKAEGFSREEFKFKKKNINV